MSQSIQEVSVCGKTHVVKIDKQDEEVLLIKHAGGHQALILGGLVAHPKFLMKTNVIEKPLVPSASGWPHTAAASPSSGQRLCVGK